MFDAPQQPRAQGLLGLLNASFRLGRFFGVEVRVYWLALLFVPLIAHGYQKGVPTGQAWLIAVILTLLLYVIIWSHEMGHIVAGRRYGIHTPLITLSPIGGLAHMSAPAPSPNAEIRISLAGPLVHLPWAAVGWALWIFVFDRDYFDANGSPSTAAIAASFLAWTNLILLAFNLLPFFPMDGGRVLRAALAKRMHASRATWIATGVGMAGAVLFMVVPLTGWVGYPVLIFVIGLSNLFACIQERRMIRYVPDPYAAPGAVDPWSLNTDAWKGGGDITAQVDRAAEKAEKARAKARAEAEALEKEVDRILAKVSDVGMAGLTKKEKRTLQRASEAKRRR